MPTLLDLHEELQNGFSGTPVLPTWADRDTEWKYYRNQGHNLVPQREVEDLSDYNRRPKIACHITHKVVEELSKGLYAHPGPVRVAKDKSVDTVMQAVDAEHNLNAILHNADAYSWLHGFSAVQVISNPKHLMDTGAGHCPVCLRSWRADETFVFVEDDDPTCPWAVLIRSIWTSTKQIRLQIWTATEYQTWYSRYKDTNIFDADRTSSGMLIQFDHSVSARFQIKPSESGTNPYGVIPFVFFRNDPSTEYFNAPGLGETLVSVCKAADQLLSDLQQALMVYQMPEKYGNNISTTTRMVNRPGNVLELIERDPAREAKIYFNQPEIRVEETWEHVQNAVNETLEGLDIPIRVSVQLTNQPESGVALVMRRIPLTQKWQARQGVARIFERDLARLVGKVWGITAGDQGLIRASQAVEVEVDYPEPSFPIPSMEKDQSDDWELSHGLKSRVQLVMERYGKTRQQALEHLEQVAKDEAEATPAPIAPAEPGDSGANTTVDEELADGSQDNSSE